MFWHWQLARNAPGQSNSVEPLAGAPAALRVDEAKSALVPQHLAPWPHRAMALGMCWL